MAGMVKWLTRRIVAPLCVGSIPTTRPIFNFIWGYSQAVRQRTLTPSFPWFESRYPSHEPLAQLVEHLTFNQRVEGSSPSWLIILYLFI